MMKMKQTYKSIHEMILEHETFVLASHISPEGDALGSMLGLMLMLEKIGKQVKAFNADPVPAYLKFLPAQDKVFHTIEELGDPDIVIVLDCGDIKRTGMKFNQFLSLKQRQIINIDHHSTNHKFGKINLVQPQASSVGEVLYEMFVDLDLEISLDAAINLYTAILTDTGSFRFPNTSPRTLHIAANLVELGVKPADIARAVYDSQPASKLMLLARVLATMQISPDSQRAEMMLTNKMLEETGTTSEDAEGFINYLSAIQGIKVAMLIREMGQGIFKVSFRSPGKVDVAELAKTFGGGGHREAAGATMGGSLEKIRDSINKRLDELLAETAG